LLKDAGGDVKKAMTLAKEKHGKNAENRAGRVTRAGRIEVYIHHDGKSGGLIEVNCETDFVARNEEFKAFANEVAEVVARDGPPDVTALERSQLRSGQTIEARRTALVQKIGENMSIRRFVRREAKGKLASYVHGVKIGALVDVSSADAQLGKELAMQIAALKPQAVDKSQVPAETVAKEREIAAAQVAEDGKTGEMATKIIEGKVNKAVAAMTLLGQAFVKGDGKQTVEQLLKAKGATVYAFTLYVVGEGIERKKDDFAAEVAAMAKSA